MPMPAQLIGTQTHRKPKSKSKKAGLDLPVQKLWQKMKRGQYANHIRIGGAVYMTAVLQYLCAEILEVSGEVTKKKKKKIIVPRHLSLAVKSDEELDLLLKDVTFAQGGVVPFINPVLLKKSKIPSKKRSSSDE